MGWPVEMWQRQLDDGRAAVVSGGPEEFVHDVFAGICVEHLLCLRDVVVLRDHVRRLPGASLEQETFD